MSVRFQMSERICDVVGCLLLMLFGGLTMKWWTIIPQMKKINNVGIRKFIMHVQKIQYCWNKNERLVFTDTKFIFKRIASIFLSDEKGLSILDTHIIDWEKALAITFPFPVFLHSCVEHEGNCRQDCECPTNKDYSGPSEVKLVFNLETSNFENNNCLRIKDCWQPVSLEWNSEINWSLGGIQHSALKIDLQLKLYQGAVIKKRCAKNVRPLAPLKCSDICISPFVKAWWKGNKCKALLIKT